MTGNNVDLIEARPDDSISSGVCAVTPGSMRFLEHPNPSSGRRTKHGSRGPVSTLTGESSSQRSVANASE